MTLQFLRLYRGNQGQQLPDIETAEVALLYSCRMNDWMIRALLTTIMKVLYKMGMGTRIEADLCTLPKNLWRVGPIRGPLRGSMICDIPKFFTEPSTYEISPKSFACDLSLFPGLLVFHTNGSSCCPQSVLQSIEGGSEVNQLKLQSLMHCFEV